MKTIDVKKLEKSDVVDVKALAKSLAEKKLIAQNNNNFGNFTWGIAAHAMGVPEWAAKFGAQKNNYLTDPENVGKEWYDRKFDSVDDLYSISLGFQKGDILEFRRKQNAIKN